jgi:hypothetical protein
MSRSVSLRSWVLVAGRIMLLGSPGATCGTADWVTKRPPSAAFVASPNTYNLK